jgi:secondary thiamine-phosphate synthase enzyme
MAEPGRIISAQKPSAGLQTFRVDTHQRVEFKDITNLIRKCISDSGVHTGVCHIFVPHTSAGILIQENDDPALQRDLAAFLEKLAPQDGQYHHNDGNCDSHLKSAMVGCSQTLLVDEGRPILGRWQGVFLCEFDGPRQRELRVKVVPD